MKILIVSALFPPNIVGGAEISAFNNACYHRDQGHEIFVLTTAKDKADELHGEMVQGMRVWRLLMPRLYSALNAVNHPAWKKALYHLQDHIDPRNRWMARRVIEQVKPDYAYIHVVQGLGWNILDEIARAGIRSTYFLHDLSLACYRTTMYKGGQECKKQCSLCKASCLYKTSMLRKIGGLKFISPSWANLERVAKFVPVKDYPNTSILNPNKYPVPTVPREESDCPRLLYVGRLDSLKGVDLLLAVADELARTYQFKLTLVGTGRDEAAYREKYASKPWCHFAGFVSREEVSNTMVNADVLCVPSVWFENSPGAAIQALSFGIPVIGSNHGGIGELVEHDKNGILVAAGDHQAWKKAIQMILEDGSVLEGWRAYAKATNDRFDAEKNGQRIFEFSLKNKTYDTGARCSSDKAS